MLLHAKDILIRAIESWVLHGRDHLSRAEVLFPRIMGCIGVVVFLKQGAVHLKHAHTALGNGHLKVSF
jgi:hypothetical protein